MEISYFIDYTISCSIYPINKINLCRYEYMGIVFDEYDAGRPDVMFVIQRVLEFDGRLTLLGTDGYIELRKYVDVAGRAGTDSLILVNGSRCETMDGREAGLPYFDRFAHDIAHRTETAMSQTHCFKVMELALEAQRLAEAGRS